MVSSSRYKLATAQSHSFVSVGATKRHSPAVLREPSRCLKTIWTHYAEWPFRYWLKNLFTL